MDLFQLQQLLWLVLSLVVKRLWGTTIFFGHRCLRFAFEYLGGAFLPFRTTLLPLPGDPAEHVVGFEWLLRVLVRDSCEFALLRSPIWGFNESDFGLMSAVLLSSCIRPGLFLSSSCVFRVPCSFTDGLSNWVSISSLNWSPTDWFPKCKCCWLSWPEPSWDS